MAPPGFEFEPMCRRPSTCAAYAKAAANLRLLATTMKDVSDDLLTDVAMLNEATGGLVGN